MRVPVLVPLTRVRVLVVLLLGATAVATVLVLLLARGSHGWRDQPTLRVGREMVGGRGVLERDPECERVFARGPAIADFAGNRSAGLVLGAGLGAEFAGRVVLEQLTRVRTGSTRQPTSPAARALRVRGLEAEGRASHVLALGADDAPDLPVTDFPVPKTWRALALVQHPLTALLDELQLGMPDGPQASMGEAGEAMARLLHEMPEPELLAHLDRLLQRWERLLAIEAAEATRKGRQATIDPPLLWMRVEDLLEDARTADAWHRDHCPPPTPASTPRRADSTEATRPAPPQKKTESGPTLRTFEWLRFLRVVAVDPSQAGPVPGPRAFVSERRDSSWDACAVAQRIQCAVEHVVQTLRGSAWFAMVEHADACFRDSRAVAALAVRSDGTELPFAAWWTVPEIAACVRLDPRLAPWEPSRLDRVLRARPALRRWMMRFGYSPALLALTRPNVTTEWHSTAEHKRNNILAPRDRVSDVPGATRLDLGVAALGAAGEESALEDPDPADAALARRWPSVMQWRPPVNCTHGRYLLVTGFDLAGIGHSVAGYNFMLRIAMEWNLTLIHFADMFSDQHDLDRDVLAYFRFDEWAVSRGEWESCALHSPVRARVFEPRNPTHRTVWLRNASALALQKVRGGFQPEARAGIDAFVRGAGEEGFTLVMGGRQGGSLYTLRNYAETGPLLRARLRALRRRGMAPYLSPRAVDRGGPRVAHMALHVRRGDIALRAKYSDRFLNDDFWLDVAREVLTAIAPLPVPLVITVFSEGLAADFTALVDGLRALAPSGSDVRLDLDPSGIRSFHRLLWLPDILLAARSGFSHIAAMLREDTVKVYLPGDDFQSWDGGVNLFPVREDRSVDRAALRRAWEVLERKWEG